MKKNILVLDDSEFHLNLLRDLLKRLNYDVTTVDNGKDACQRVKSAQYDLIITDMNMPDMDGIEFTRQVRTYPGCRFLPIVMVSSETNEERISEAKNVGVSTFISKPLKEAQLKAMLEIILNKRMTPRVPVKLKIYYREDKSFSNFNASFTFNLSRGGVFIETLNPSSPGKILELKLSLPENDHPVTCQGRVTWVNDPVSPCNKSHPPGMGLQFLKLDDEHLLNSFLKSGPKNR